MFRATAENWVLSYPFVFNEPGWFMFVVNQTWLQPTVVCNGRLVPRCPSLSFGSGLTLRTEQYLPITPRRSEILLLMADILDTPSPGADTRSGGPLVTLYRLCRSNDRNADFVAFRKAYTFARGKACHRPGRHCRYSGTDRDCRNSVVGAQETLHGTRGE
jgi:hypothetical protein